MRIKNLKKISFDLVFTISAVLIFNCVLQFLVYPRLNALYGDIRFGSIVYYMSFVSIFATSIGMKVNDERLIFSKNNRANIFDSFKTLFIVLVFSLVAFFIYGSITQAEILSLLYTSILIFITTFRYYADVFFRLKKNFLGYLLYYIILSFGYVVGLLLQFIYQSWFLVFVTGEVFALVFVTIIYLCNKNNISKSPSAFKPFFKEAILLILSFLIYSVSLNLDRIMLKEMVGELAVTQYYVASLIGKTIALLITPINTLLISYGEKIKSKLNTKSYSKIVFLMVIFTLGFFFLATFVSKIFARIFYPTVYLAIKDNISIITLGQILIFSSSILLSILLLLAPAKWQLIIQSIYTVVYFVLLYVLLMAQGFIGVAYAGIIAGAFKLILVIAITMTLINKINSIRVSL